MDAPINLPQGYTLDAPGLPVGYTLDTPTSVAGSVGLGALDAIPFGLKGAAQAEEAVKGGKAADYLKELDALVAKQKEEHPIAHATGEVAGSVAPFAIPGVGEALGSETLAGRAAIGAGIGGLQAASNTRQPLSSPQGIQDIVKGAETGAVLNPAIGAVGDALSSAGSKAAEGLEDFANKKTVQSLGMKPGELGVPSSDIQDMGNLAHELGADKGDLESRYNILQDATQQAGKQIEDLGQGKTLTDTAPYTQRLHDALQESSAVYGPQANPEASIYRQGIANLQKEGGITFDELQQLKNAYADRAFDKVGNVKPNGGAAFNAYKTVSDAMEQLASDSPEYPDLKKAYSVVKSMRDGIAEQFQKEQATGSQAKGFGLAGKMGAMVTGGNIPATVGLAGAIAPAHPFMGLGLASTIFTNPEAMSTASRALSNVASTGVSNTVSPAVTNAITNSNPAPKIPPQYAPVFQKATQGITDPAEKQKQMSITDFVLQSRDPNYAKAKKDIEGF